MFVLGIDQGHTQTRAALSDTKGNILSVGKAQGACHSLNGMAQAMQAIREAAEAALRQTDLRGSDISIMYCGLTGADWPDEYDRLRENIESLGLSDSVEVKNDAIIALRGGTSSTYGAVVVAGTGANCAIRSPAGEEFLYGYYVETDLQGGIALGRRALKAIYRAETGRELPTSLTTQVLGMFECDGVDDLLRAHVETRLTYEAIVGIAPLVFQASCDGDPVACGILRAFGEGLAELVTAGLRRFHMTALDLEVVLSGNIFKGPGDLLQGVMGAHIHRVAPKAKLISAKHEPVVGAVLLGLEKVGVMVDQTVAAKIEASSKKLNLFRTTESPSKRGADGSAP